MTTHYHNGEVKLYDSLSNGKILPSLEEQLVQIYQPEVQYGGLLVILMPVQQQTGSADCGLFSIAYAYHAACGDDLQKLALDQTQMGSHLLKCFVTQELTPFPQSASAPARRTKNAIALFLFSVCVACQNALIPTWWSVISVSPGFISSV